MFCEVPLPKTVLSKCIRSAILEWWPNQASDQMLSTCVLWLSVSFHENRCNWRSIIDLEKTIWYKNSHNMMKLSIKGNMEN